MAKATPRNGVGTNATDTPLGFQYTSTVSVPSGFGGQFMVIQTMTSGEIRSWIDSNGVRHDETLGRFANLAPPFNGQSFPLASTTVLDTQVGYGGRIDDPKVGPGSSDIVNMAPVGHTLFSSDSPASPLTFPTGKGIDWSRQDNFTITLMYNPEIYNPATTDPNVIVAGAPQTIWVPVGQMTWYWKAYAKFDPGTKLWIDTVSALGNASTSGSGAYAATTTFPEWSVNDKDVKQNWH